MRNVAILIFDEAEVLDFAGPFEVFSVASEINNHQLFRVFTVSTKTDPIKAVNGLTVVPDFSIWQHPPVDILIVSGGQGTKALLKNEEALEWLRKTVKNTEFTLSICSGARLLGKIGVLDHKRFCTHHEVYDDLAKIAPTAVPQKDKRFVQTNETVYTSGGISAGIDLSFHVLERLTGIEIAERTAEYMEYRHNYN